MLTDNLVAFWPMHETVNNPRVDVAGNGNTLTAASNMQSGPGVIGLAAVFPGTVSTQGLHINQNHFLDAQSGKTLVFNVWFLLANKAQTEVIFMMGNTSFEFEYYFLYDHTADRLVFGVNSGGTEVKATANAFGSPPTGTPIMATCTLNAAGVASVEINAAGIDSAAITFPSTVASGVFWVGKHSDTSDNPLTGWVQLFGVWQGRTLFPYEVAELYQSGKALDYPLTLPLIPFRPTSSKRGGSN